MSCQFCSDGYATSKTDGKTIHFVGKEWRYCEEPMIPPVSSIDEVELKRLFRIAAVASEIRMQHDIPIFTAMDWAREVILPGASSIQQAVDYSVQQHGHICTPACTQPKQVY